MEGFMNKLSITFNNISNQLNLNSGFYYPNYLLGLTTLGIIDLINSKTLTINERYQITIKSSDQNPLSQSLLKNESKSLDQALIDFLLEYREDYIKFLNNDSEMIDVNSFKQKLHKIYDEDYSDDLVVFIRVLIKADVINKLYNRDETKAFRKRIKEIKLDENCQSLKILNQVERIYALGLSLYTTIFA